MEKNSHHDPAQQGGVPEELRQLNQWIRWKLELNRQGRKTKIPYHPNGEQQFATSRDEPYTFENVLGKGDCDETEGIGFVLRTDGDGVKHPTGLDCTLVAIDADGCRDPLTGALTPWGRELFELTGRTYTEVSPSGCGFRAFVWVDNLPTDLARSKVKVPHPAAPNVPEYKAVEVQLFTTTGYVTVTGERLIEASALIERKPSLDWLTSVYPQFREQDRDTGKLPVGRGDAPTVEQIGAEINRSAPNVREAVVDANWPAIMPNDEGSASEGYYRVVQHVLRAAHGHGAPAVDYLLQETDWGLGLCDDSADPLKYARRNWVRKEVGRVGGKASTTNAAEAFDDGFDAKTWTPDETATPESKRSVILDLFPSAPRRWSRNRPPDRRFLLRHPEDDAGALPLGEVGILSAEGGAGKTTAVVQLAIAIATGGRWFGHYKIDEGAPNRVLALLGEEDQEECDRKLYWAAHRLGLSDEQVRIAEDRITMVPLAGHYTPLLRPGPNGPEATEHGGAIRDVLNTPGDPWGLVIVDPLSRFAGVNVEADNIDATRFIVELESFCKAPGTPTTLCLAHSSKAARRLGEADNRGVTGLTDGARWWGTLVNAGKERARFDVRKSNYTRPAEELGLVRGELGVLQVESTADKEARKAIEVEDAASRELRKERERHDHIGRLLARLVDTILRIPGLSKSQACAETVGKRADLMEALDRGLANGTLEGHREGSRMVLTVAEIFR